MAPSPSRPLSRSTNHCSARFSACCADAPGNHPFGAPPQRFQPQKYPIERRPDFEPVADRIRRRYKALANVGAGGIDRSCAQRIQDEQRNHDRSRPVRNPVQRKQEPARQQHDLGRNVGHRGPGHLLEPGQQDAREDIGALGTAVRQDPFPGPLHRRTVGILAAELERQIRLDGAREVTCPAMEQWPGALFHLFASRNPRSATPAHDRAHPCSAGSRCTRRESCSRPPARRASDHPGAGLPANAECRGRSPSAVELERFVVKLVRVRKLRHRPLDPLFLQC